MNIQEENKKWLAEIQEELESVNNELQTLESEEVIFNMKSQMITQLSSKFKSNYLEKYQNRLREIELRVDHLKEVAHDLRILEVHVASKFQE